MTSLNKLLLENFGSPIRYSCSAGGGCIADARIVTLASGRALFVKQLGRETDAFFCEARGLKELASAECLRIPEVHLVTSGVLVLEVIEPQPRNRDFQAQLGQGLARLHQVQRESFGFVEDNYLGDSPQYNAPEEKQTSWVEFFWEYRLKAQLQLAENKGLETSRIRPLLHALESRLPRLLSGTEEAPSLLHGDLWSGNVMSDETGAPCLIDPAVYYGHREAELGMMELFGGFTEECYQAYDEAFPLLPDWRERLSLYKLYHVLNHWNLFGGGYLSQAMNLIRQYL